MSALDLSAAYDAAYEATGIDPEEVVSAVSAALPVIGRALVAALRAEREQDARDYHGSAGTDKGEEHQCGMAAAADLVERLCGEVR